MTTIYKVREKATGLFSNGGEDPRCNKTGKTWSKLRFVKSHVANLLNSCNYRISYKLAEKEKLEAAKNKIAKEFAERFEIVGYDLVETTILPFERSKKK